MGACQQVSRAVNVCCPYLVAAAIAWRCPLTLQLDSRQEGVDQGHFIHLELAFLRSYAHMGEPSARPAGPTGAALLTLCWALPLPPLTGVAEISCVAGCSCKPHTLDAHQAKRESTTQLHTIPATQHETCIINVTVSNTTNCPTGEHKFKISGLIVMDETPGERL